MKNTLWKQIGFCGLLILGCSCQHSQPESPRHRLDLAGNWALALDTTTLETATILPSEIVFTDSMFLPGTTDLAKKGFYNTDRSETNALSREYQFEGRAVYAKTLNIPDNWDGSAIRLLMERTKPTAVYVDGQQVGSNDDISTAQIYELTGFLSPGEHELQIVVDNRPTAVPAQVFHSSHAYSPSTQTNWNGIIGNFYLESIPETGIESVQVTPDYTARNARVKVKLRQGKADLSGAKIILQARAENSKQNFRTPPQVYPLTATGEEQVFDLPLGADAPLWSEFDPAFYTLTVQLEGDSVQDIQDAIFGLREFKTQDKKFVINDKTTFLRGKHDACVFPLTGHTAMDVETWRHYFQVAKQYGINHYRFHSWCPPEACFEAADIEGIYLQPELPIWGSLDKQDTLLCNYLIKEGKNLHDAYSNHPSFVMFALGNEMWGEEALAMVVDSLRAYDNRHLFASGSNNFLGFSGPLPNEDYVTTCRLGQEDEKSFATHTHASFSFADAYDGGYLNHTYPNSKMNFEGANERTPLPVIGHETGQFQVYPNYAEMQKYTGALKPYNMEIFRQRLKEAGMENQAEDFRLASGKWSAILYRADVEMNLRTPDWGGFQLLDLQDYPGQGSAYVGLLDAFMDSKGLITPEEWRQSCSEVVPLLVCEEFCFSNEDLLTGKVLIANYSADALQNKTLNWQLTDSKQQLLDQGQFIFTAGQGALDVAGELEIPLGKLQKAEKLNLALQVEGTSYQNNYPVWVYPAAQTETAQTASVQIARKMDDALLRQLEAGETVLLFPTQETVEAQTVPGLFQTDYWNYRMFKTICENLKRPVSPGTLGILTNPEHPLFADFPTESHTNWQWFPVIKQSYPMILDLMPADYQPLVQVIDNVERNHKLGLVYEMNAGNGKLLVCMADLEPVMNYPEARQFYNSLLNYAASDQFAPEYTLTPGQLQQLFTAKPQTGQIKRLGNISYED